jgi:hypothetical protein
VKRPGEKSFGLQADLKRGIEECSSEMVISKKKGNEKCFSICMLQASYTKSVFSNYVVRRRDGEKGFTDNVIRNKSSEQVFSEHVSKRSFCSCEVDGRGSDQNL